MKRTLLIFCVLISSGLLCAQNVDEANHEHGEGHGKVIGHNIVHINDINIKETPAHKLAETLFYYNPSKEEQEARDSLALPENDWFDHLKTSYDETFVVDSDPGKYITIARRSGSDWYVGMTTNDDAAEISVPLSYLCSETNRMYFAYIYTDGGHKVDTKTHIRCQLLCVNSRQILKFALKPNGGAAVRLSPILGMAYREIDAYEGQTL